MYKIQKVSKRLVTIFTVLAFLAPLFTLAQWLLIEWEPFRALVKSGLFFSTITTPEGMVNLGDVHLTTLGRIIGLGGGLIGCLSLVAGFVVLRQLFARYAHGVIFSRENSQRFSQLGWLFFLDALLVKPLSTMTNVLAVTLSNPPGHRYLVLRLGTPSITNILCGVVIILISWVMVEAQKNHDDQQLTI